MSRFVWVISFVCLFSPSLLEAQKIIDHQPIDTSGIVSLAIQRGKVNLIHPISDSLRLFADNSKQENNLIVEKPHSPSKALCLSLLPGAGQIYNHQAWKAPIIYALMGGLSYWSYSCYVDMKMFRDEYLLRVNGEAPSLEGYTGYSNSSIYNLYLSNNQYFQLGIVLTILVYGLNLLDAYVYGHLFDFQIDDNLSLSITPMSIMNLDSTFGFSPSLGLSLRF